VLRFCENDNIMRASERSIKISPRGTIYLAKALGDHWPAEVKHARLGYDEEIGLLVVEPAAADTPGARTVTRGNKNEVRMQFSVSLRFFGLCPTESFKLSAQWIHGRIEVHWPPPWPRKEVLAPEGPESTEPAERKGRDPQIPADSGKSDARDLAKAAALEASLDFEDSIPPNTDGTPAAEVLLDAKEIQRKFAITQGYLYVLCSKGKFPKSVSNRGRALLWRRVDVETWAAQRVRPRPAVVPPPVSGPLSPPPEILTGKIMGMQQIADLMQVSPSYLYRLRSAGKLPAEMGKRGRESFWSQPVIEAWAEGQKTRARVKRADPPASSPVGQPRCSNCAAGVQMREDGGVCGNQTSPRFAKRVLPRDCCEQHKPWRPKSSGGRAEFVRGIGR